MHLKWFKIVRHARKWDDVPLEWAKMKENASEVGQNASELHENEGEMQLK